VAEHARCWGALETDDLVSLFGRAWVTALPAHAEAFPLTLLESLACGTPVVALDEGGPREIVTPGIGALAGAEAPTAASVAEACRIAIDLAREPDIAERCRAAAMQWDWRASILPQMERIYSA
jgi:glycosyltransferase involved in cell wall biosynthesis